MAVRSLSSQRGQMTVELAVALPVLLVVALVCVNALLFFSECAAFDNAFRDAVRIHAASPAYGQGLEQSIAQVQAALDGSFESTRVSAEGASFGHVRFSATIEFKPTLFGQELKSSVFGVSLPSLKHASSLVVDLYKPGVLL